MTNLHDDPLDHPAAVSAFLTELSLTRAVIDADALEAVDHASHGGVDALALLLHDLEATRRKISMAEDAVRGVLYGVLPSGITEVDGLGTLEPKSGAKRKDWDTPRLVPRVVRQAALEAGAVDDDGTVVKPAWWEGAAAATEALTIAARLEWRVGRAKAGTGLARFGIDAADYCTELAGRSTVVSRWHDLEDTSPDNDLAEVIRLPTLRDPNERTGSGHAD